MAKFRFELEAVLTARIAAERRCQLAVAELEAERIGIEMEIQRLQRGMGLERDQMRTSLKGRDGTVDLPAARMQAAAAVRLTATAQQAVLRLAGVHRRLEGVRAELIKAATARRAVELLRERRFEAWRRDLIDRENKAVDELAVMRGNALAADHGGELGEEAGREAEVLQ